MPEKEAWKSHNSGTVFADLGADLVLPDPADTVLEVELKGYAFFDISMQNLSYVKNCT